jgi:outer membrane protein OmpA-like peptidoglycan-associated protein
MSGRRFSPWPAYVDLFSGLVVLMFAVIAVDVARQSPAQQMAADVLANISKATREVKPCSDQDLCVNLLLNFETGKDEIRKEDLREIQRITSVLLGALQEQERKNPQLNIKKLVRIVVEGHTDSRPLHYETREREQFTYNWNLSARRASSVMYALSQNNLGLKQGYNVVSLGLASSEPARDPQDPDGKRDCIAQRDVCAPTDDACREAADSHGPDRCDDMNRRTTIRIIFDYKAAGIQQRPGVKNRN